MDKVKLILCACKFFLFCFICSIFFNATVSAHEQIKLQIFKVNQQLRVNPNETGLILHRASLHFAHGDFTSALKDARNLKKNSANYEKAWVIEIKSLLALKHYSEALSITKQAIKLWPNNVDIILLNARTQAKFTKKVKKSLANYNKAISMYRKPNPALLIERADLQITTGIEGHEMALEQLNKARHDYGFIFVAQKKALDIALKFEHLDRALEITKDICHHFNRHDKWLKVMGDIHTLQGNKFIAQQYYRKALVAIEALSNRQRNHVKTIDLKNELMKLVTSKTN